MIYKNKETGEITEGKIFKTSDVQIINPTNEILAKYGWEIINEYPIIEDSDEETIEDNNEENN